jgi:hypothetical protein
MDGDPPSVGMLARERREAARCLGQDEAEFRELRSDDAKQTTHDLKVLVLKCGPDERERRNAPFSSIEYGVHAALGRLFRADKKVSGRVA